MAPTSSANSMVSVCIALLLDDGGAGGVNAQAADPNATLDAHVAPAMP